MVLWSIGVLLIFMTVSMISGTLVDTRRSYWLKLSSKVSKFPDGQDQN